MKYDHERFLAYWKTDDKDWVKQRKSEWKNIQWQFDRLRENYIFLHRVKKSDYRYFKNYFLTGKDISTMPQKESCRCLNKYNPNSQENLLIHFWLSADHSRACLEYLNENMSSRESEINNKLTRFWDACNLYRMTVRAYPKGIKYGWNEEEGTTEKNGSIFGDLESSMLDIFTFSSEHRKKLDERINKPMHDSTHTNFEGVFIGYFDKYIEEAGIRDGFNPNNPIRYMLDEYIRWGFPQNRGEFDILAFKLSIAIVWHTVDTANGRHTLQLEVAIELKQRILVALPSMPTEAQKRYDIAMKYYDSGEFKEYLLDYQ